MEGGRRRLRLEVRGAVQGVGFRPFVYRTASRLGLGGWVVNDPRGVVIEAEGAPAALASLTTALRASAPPSALVEEVLPSWLPPSGEREFRIRPSEAGGARTALVLPDLATCPECAAEIADPDDRRRGYAFTNCTQCGPRFSVIRALPYDRPNTTMAGFRMCPRCAAEYSDPLDRRFHAQPDACPACGPTLDLLDRGGGRVPGVADDAAVIAAAARALEDGRVVAVKGLGGFHLVVDARSSAAVARLRARKHRPAKPLAVMVRDLGAAARECEVGPEEAALLASPEAPIVLLRRRPDASVVADVAPGNPSLGVMLPCTPLHHLLLDATGFPLVATSGNRSEEPICTGTDEALERLGAMADLFLVHDRPIERHVDDSVARVLDGVPRLLRRARGYAPLPIRLSRAVPTILAVGGHLKNTVALSRADHAFLSQHIGDLETPEAQRAFERVIADFLRLYEAAPVAIAHDLHPEYVSTRWAEAAVARAGATTASPVGLAGLPLVPVQHHHAHLAACLAEHREEGPALGVIWDGTGYGPDRTVWGGEFLVGDARAYQRVAHLLPFRLPGGEAAVREPRRTGLALLHGLLGDGALERRDLPPVAAFRKSERRLLQRMLVSGVGAPATSSAGRLFDGVAGILGLCERNSFEGEAAQRLEFAADAGERGAYPLAVVAVPGAPTLLDWRPLLGTLLEDLGHGVPIATMAARVHNGLVQGAVALAGQASLETVVLSGGCFQNRRLAEGLATALRARGHRVLLHRTVPPNDGGLAVGQLAVAAAALAARRPARAGGPAS